jgi:hypothetical protein
MPMMKKIDENTKKILLFRFKIGITVISFLTVIAFFLHYIVKASIDKVVVGWGAINWVFLIWATFPLKNYYITTFFVLNFLIFLILITFTFFSLENYTTIFLIMIIFFAILQPIIHMWHIIERKNKSEEKNG